MRYRRLRLELGDALSVCDVCDEVQKWLTPDAALSHQFLTQ